MKRRIPRLNEDEVRIAQTEKTNHLNKSVQLGEWRLRGYDELGR